MNEDIKSEWGGNIRFYKSPPELIKDLLNKYMDNQEDPHYLGRLWRYHYRRYDAIERLTELNRIWLEDDKECMEKKNQYIKRLSDDDLFPYVVEVLKRGIENPIEKDLDPRP